MPNLQSKKNGATHARLRAKIYDAIKLLETRYDNPPSATELARAAGISLYHFHRIFRQIVGESVSQHSKRLRLERAASLLKFSSWRISDIALACGFQTSSSFDSAFKKLYAMSPRAYRNNHLITPFLRRNAQFRASNGTHPIQYHLPLTVRMESWPETRAVCMRFYGSIYQLYKPWEEILRWARDNISNLECARFFGLWFDDWSDLTDQSYRYECVIIPEKNDFKLPPPFSWRTFEAGQVAITEASGNIAQLENSWRIFAYDWLPFSGFQPRGEFVLDQYPSDLVLSPLLSKLAKGLTRLNISLCLPVQIEPVNL